MKLLTKLTLFITLSKIGIVVLFVLLLPSLVGRVSFEYSNYYLTRQKKKVLEVVAKNGLGYYLQGDSTYGSYTMLKEEYISLVPASGNPIPDTLETSRRIVDEDTINYRVLTHTLLYQHHKYVLEIGKTTAAISEYNNLLQRFTLYVLAGLIIISLLADLIYTQILLKPLGKIVRTKLLNRKFPFRESLSPVKTSTSDFRFLDSSLISLMEKIHEAFNKEREFTSNASHELMTPISIIQTNIENMMADESLSDAQLEKLAGMMKTSGRLKKIVHSLLFISRIENEQFTKIDTVNMHDLVTEVMEELSHRLEVGSIRFTNKLSPNSRLKSASHDLLFQLLYNLINNAIRYNKEGGTIVIEEEQVPGQYYRLRVTDTGTGIRAGELGTIFNRFKRSAQATGEGYGLGLSIVKSIVLYHEGTITVASEYGAGTEFVMAFPEKMIP